MIGNKFSGPILPLNDSDPTHISGYGKGGLHTSVDTTTDRDNIPVSKREHGMIVAVGNNSTSGGIFTNYQLIIPNWYALDNSAKLTALANNSNWSNLINVTSPIQYGTSGTITISQSSTSGNGYLSSTDYNTFNKKINSVIINGSNGTNFTLTSSNISEGTNFYYTDARVNANTTVINGATAYSWGNQGTQGFAVLNATNTFSVAQQIPTLQTLDFNGTSWRTTLTSSTSGVLTIGSGWTSINPAVPITGYLTTAVANSSYLTISNPVYTGTLTTGTLSYSDINTILSLQSNVNSYNQFIIQNSSNGTSASSDIIVNNNNSTATTYYGDFGMNSSSFVGVGSFNLPNAVYLSATTSDLSIGTTTSNQIHFVTNNNTIDALTINSNNAIAFNSVYGTSGQVLKSNGSSSSPTWITPTSISRIISNIGINTTAGNALYTDYIYIATAVVQLTLPTAVNNSNVYTFKNAFSSNCTVVFTSGQNADGSTSIIVTPNESLSFVSDNSNYKII